MKNSLLTCVLFLLMANGSYAAKSLFELRAPQIDGGEQPLSQYRGKIVMVVNTASKCGYTPQYQGLEALYTKYKDRGFVLLGFPSNDFGAQEPGTNAEIKKFCELRFHVTFPLFGKDPVTGSHKQTVYHYLTEESAPEFRGEVKWNFEKFLLDKEGHVVARYRSAITPESPEVQNKLEGLLK